MTSIKPGISVADTKGISERISWRSGAARAGPGDPAVSAAVSVALIWKVSGERLILPVSVGIKSQPRPPVPVAVILWLEQRISATFLALPKQSIWRSDCGHTSAWFAPLSCVDPALETLKLQHDPRGVDGAASQ
jgi:hypothetical protein